MQHARQRAPETLPAPRKRASLRPAGPQDASAAGSPARDLQTALHTAYAAPEPVVPSWPGWAKLTVLAVGAALSWAGVVGVAKLLL